MPEASPTPREGDRCGRRNRIWRVSRRWPSTTGAHPTPLMGSKFVAGLKTLRSADCLPRLFFAPADWQRLRQRLYVHEGVVYAKPPLGGPEAVLETLGRYTHRVAVSNERILGIEGNTSITCCWVTNDCVLLFCAAPGPSLASFPNVIRCSSSGNRTLPCKEAPSEHPHDCSHNWPYRRNAGHCR